MTKAPPPPLQLKLTFIEGLKDIVLNELSSVNGVVIQETNESQTYLKPIDINQVIKLRSVLKAHYVMRGNNLTPKYITKHKSILGDIINTILSTNHDTFKSFKLIGAGTDSPEVRSIARYISDTFKLEEVDDADLKIHMIKVNDIWEAGVELTSSPLSVRDYKVRNMEGAMNPTIAYAANSLAIADQTKSYINPFSGSATLLIEAGLAFKDLETLIGLDYDKDTISLAMQNIKQSGLIRRISLKQEDICDIPQLGQFDAIVSDLPFGMTISKYDDLQTIYNCLLKFAQKSLSKNGIMVLYTVKHDLLEPLLKDSDFDMVKSIELKLYSTKGLLLRPKLFVCMLK